MWWILNFFYARLLKRPGLSFVGWPWGALGALGALGGPGGPWSVLGVVGQSESLGAVRSGIVGALSGSQAPMEAPWKANAKTRAHKSREGSV